MNESRGWYDLKPDERDRRRRMRTELVELDALIGLRLKAERRAHRRERRKASDEWERRYFALSLQASKYEGRERARLAALMQSAPGASSVHRGVKSTFNITDLGAVRRERDRPRERVQDGRHHPVTRRLSR